MFFSYWLGAVAELGLVTDQNQQHKNTTTNQTSGLIHYRPPISTITADLPHTSFSPSHTQLINMATPYASQIILVGFYAENNGRSCDVHPGGCGNLVLDRDDVGVGLVLQLVYIQDRNELALHILNEDGSLGCRVGFSARQYANAQNGPRYDGALVKIDEMNTKEDENPAKRQLAYRNFGYARATVIEFTVVD